MEIKYRKPEDIEKRSMEIIADEMTTQPPEERLPVIRRVIHTTADFEYEHSLRFSEHAIRSAQHALQNGATIVTDTNMVRAGINQKALERHGCRAVCYMSDPQVAAEATERGVTRAVVSMEHAAELEDPLLFAIGNAPTALIRLHELILEGRVRPALVIGVPVGFVNVVEAKELFLCGDRRMDVPYIIAAGRKGGSTVAAAICNALLYMLDA